MKEIFNTCITTFLTVLVTGVATCVIKLINAKIDSIVQHTKDEKKIRFLQWLENDVIVKCVNTTTQTYVETLKAENNFTLEAQKVAMTKTTEAVLNVLTEADNQLLAEYVDDVTTWITTRVEAYMYENKKQLTNNDIKEE